MLRVAIVWVLAACAMTCRAEPRWCSITGRGPNDTLAYPPIARAARVHGVVLGRVVYTPAGKFVRFEPVSGPKMLENSLANQFASWSFKTNAAGDELCQTLVIAEYRLDNNGPPTPTAQIELEAGSTLRLDAVAIPYTIDTVISDPAPLRGFKLFRAKIKWKLRQAFGWIASKQ